MASGWIGNIGRSRVIPTGGISAMTIYSQGSSRDSLGRFWC